MNVLVIMVDVREYALIWKDSSPAVVEMVSRSTQVGEDVMVRYNICTHCFIEYIVFSTRY